MKIEKNVPLPNKGVAGKNNFIQEMEIGDSVFCENKYKKDTIRYAFHYRGIKYISRREGTGWRIWRAS